jgi:hypothetical protein
VVSTNLGESALGEDAVEGGVSNRGLVCREVEAMDGALGWLGTYMSRQVFPQAPSPTITSFRRISAMVSCVMGLLRTAVG